MAIVELPKAVQYVTDDEGRRIGVLLDIRAWDSLVEWIENTSDTQVAVKALTDLHAGGGPQAAGWLAWDEVREDWE